MNRRMQRNTGNGHIAGGCVVAVALAVLVPLLTTTAARAEAAPVTVPVTAPAVADGPASAHDRGGEYSARALVAAADAALAAGHPGAAIVELERARLLAPRSAAVASHLAHAREVASVSPAPGGRARRLAGLLSGSEWSGLALAGLALAAAGVVLLSWGAGGRRRTLGLVMGGVAVASLGFLAAAEVTPSRQDAVVVAASEPARIAPFPAAEAAFPLPEGAAVSVVRAHGDYVLVSAADGQGWLPRSSVETILPGSAHRP